MDVEYLLLSIQTTGKKPDGLKPDLLYKPSGFLAGIFINVILYVYEALPSRFTCTC
jgi:hypothetical protein